MQSLDFLHKVWSRVCKEGDYVFLSVKSDKWEDSCFKFDSQIKGRVRDWLRSHDPKKVDVYFCPLPFSQPRRLAKHVKPINILWSDIDEGDYKKITPNLVWESSPGRYQALWYIDRTINAEDAAEVNRTLTYFLGCDKGGWDLSQVLRIPGTYNHKYKSKPQVRILGENDKEYNLSQLARKIRHRKVESKVESDDLQEILKSYKLPSKVIDILNEEDPEPGTRSDMIWYLENKLHDAGIPPDQIIEIIKRTAWNKYKGRRDEDVRLRSELGKIIEKGVKLKKKKEEEVRFRVENFSDVMSNLATSPGWMIKDFWMKRSRGIVAGEPKSFKSTLVMDMALSVATGEPFMGQEVEQTGPVLYVQNENAHWIMKDRFEKMLLTKGLVGKVSGTGKKIQVQWPPNIHFHMINQQNFLLDQEEHQEYLEKLVKKLKPELVVFDPLYLMFQGDVSSSQELFPILQWMLNLGNDGNCSVIVIHHYNKSGEGKRGGQRMLGSTTLHGWVESAWYLQASESGKDGVGKLILEREFRGAGIHQKLDINIEMGDMGDPLYKVEFSEHTEHRSDPTSIIPDVERLLDQRGEVTEIYLEKFLGLTSKQTREILDTMISRGLCIRSKGKIRRSV